MGDNRTIEIRITAKNRVDPEVAERRLQGRSTAAPSSSTSKTPGIWIYQDGRELSGSVARWLPDVLASQGVH